MAAATFENIMRDLKNKVYHPVYFLYGPEPYYIDQIAGYIESHVLGDAEKEFNQTVLYGRDVDLATVIGNAKRFPMMSNYQVVVVREAQDMKDLTRKGSDDGDEDEQETSRSKGKDEPADPYVKYFENPLSSTILVFCFKYKSLDKRTKLGKVIEKNSVYFESKGLYDDKLPGWTESYCKLKGRKISADAARLIADFVGNDLSRIANEIDKLIINLPDGTEINATHVEKFIGVSKDFNVFELQNALISKDEPKVNRIVNYFAANQKQNPLIVTISTLFLFFNKTILYHSLKGKPNVNLASEMGVNPFFLKDYEKASRTFSLDHAVRVIGFLHEYDLRSKGVNNEGTGPGELLRELTQKIMHPQGVAGRVTA
jgi:DNA polymerase-3 subunit delta